MNFALMARSKLNKGLLATGWYPPRANGGFGEAGPRRLLEPRHNSSSAMLYTLLVIGDETLSSTSVFNFCHCAIFSTAIKSFTLGPFNGHYR